MNYYSVFKGIYESMGDDISTHESLASSAVRTASKLNAPIIVVLAASGHTSQLIAKYRPEASIIVGVVPNDARDSLQFKGQIHSDKLVRHSMASRGLEAMVCKEGETVDQLVIQCMQWAK